MADPQVYGNGSNSTVGSQIRTDYYNKTVLQEAAKVQVFSKLASTLEMPKNLGKKIKQYHIMPMLADININDQGIDAAGLTTSFESTIEIRDPALKNTGNEWVSYWAVGNHATVDATAIANAKAKAVDIFKKLGVFNTDYATTKAALLALNPPWVITENASVNGAGNLYGSSKDVGYMSGKLPVLSETGGYVNRVGFRRIELEGTFAKYGFYRQWTQESLDFDTDADLDMHLHREMIFGANELQEDMIQMDLLNSAGVVTFGGSATSKATISGEVGSESLVTYDDFVRLAVTLDNNRTPRDTTVVEGTRMVDTKTINAARFLYVSPALVPTLKRMVDNFGNKALIEVRQYGAATTPEKDELGSIDCFRIIVVMEMQHFAGVGATVTNNAGYRQTGGKYDVYPMLVVGDKSFTTISFKSGGAGKGSKFNIYTAKPGSPESYARDPYGTTGFTSIQWYYGFMCLRPERIAVLYTVAEY
jgi:N4-gp56 family major capsid protein